VKTVNVQYEAIDVRCHLMFTNDSDGRRVYSLVPALFSGPKLVDATHETTPGGHDWQRDSGRPAYDHRLRRHRMPQPEDR
jgi:hypothetical protein